jgi:hypothetical protein
MKGIPTIVASPTRDIAIAILEFEGNHRIENRDAVGFYYTVRRAPDEAESRLAVVFSGTVMRVDTSEFDLPVVEDKTARFCVFAEAAIGDFLDEHGLPDKIPSGAPAFHIECLSPRLQAWNDRAPATDDQIERYLNAHVFACWQFAQDAWELGLSDCLRLRRPLEIVQRLVSLGEGKDWKVAARSQNSIRLEALPDFIRRMRDRVASPTASVSPGERPAQETTNVTQEEPAHYVFVDEFRIADLRRANSPGYDLRKVLALCEELNQCYRSQCYHAVAGLTRALLDHVPPLFGMQSFAQVTNNYAGSKSFKECMQHLDSAARKIGDMHLHSKIRAQEALPSRTQVNFSNEVDVLLAEIVRILGTTT